MWWTRGAVVLGVALLLAGFAVGVAPRSVVDGGREVRCGTVLDVGADVGSRAGGASAGHEALCADGISGSRNATWGLLAAGVLVALVGWTGVRESGGPRPASVRVA